jgi:hypothetical protein
LKFFRKSIIQIIPSILMEERCLIHFLDLFYIRTVRLIHSIIHVFIYQSKPVTTESSSALGHTLTIMQLKGGRRLNNFSKCYMGFRCIVHTS